MNSNQLNHQGLLWNVHCIATVVLKITLILQAQLSDLKDLLVNRAAMGRARFLIYPWFFLTARPWAERGSKSTLGFF